MSLEFPPFSTLSPAEQAEHKNDPYEYYASLPLCEFLLAAEAAKNRGNPKVAEGILKERKALLLRKPCESVIVVTTRTVSPPLASSSSANTQNQLLLEELFRVKNELAQLQQTNQALVAQNQALTVQNQALAVQNQGLADQNQELKKQNNSLQIKNTMLFHENKQVGEGARTFFSRVNKLPGSSHRVLRIKKRTAMN